MLNLSLIALAIFAIAIMTVGVLEWVKGWWKKIPSWFPSVGSPVLCLILGQVVAPLVLLGVLTYVWGVVLSLMALAVTELCYQLIVQSIPQVVAGVIASVVPASAPPPPPAPPKVGP
jgi:hypothetical protein